MVHVLRIFFVQKRFCLELNETVLDAEYERLFKKVSEEFDAVGHQWSVGGVGWGRGGA